MGASDTAPAATVPEPTRSPVAGVATSIEAGAAEAATAARTKIEDAALLAELEGEQIET